MGLCGDQGGFDDCAVIHDHITLLDMALTVSKNFCLNHAFNQVLEIQDRCLMRALVADEIDPCKAAYGAENSINSSSITGSLRL